MNAESTLSKKHITFVYGNILKKLPLDPIASQQALALILTTKFKIMEGYKIIGFVGNRECYLKFSKFSALVSDRALPSGTYRIIVAESKSPPKVSEFPPTQRTLNTTSLHQNPRIDTLINEKS
jgi:hypothetical protein